MNRHPYPTDPRGEAEEACRLPAWWWALAPVAFLGVIALSYFFPYGWSPAP